MRSSATALRSAREAQLADHLSQIDEDRRQIDELRSGLDQRQKELADRLTRMRERETTIENSEQAGRKDLERSLDTRLRTAREEIDKVVNTLRLRASTLEREAAARAANEAPALSTGETGALRSEARTALEAIASGLPTPATPPSSSSHGSGPRIGVGTRVMITTLGVEGTVRSVHGRDAEVEARGKRVHVPIEVLEVAAPRPTSGEPQRRVTIQVEAPTGPLDELNVIGCRVDEALARAQKHLDQALMADQRSVRFIHGHGTGQLRRAIGDFLAAHPLVQRVAAAAPEDGGSGVTIAELKE